MNAINSTTKSIILRTKPANIFANAEKKTLDEQN